MSSIRLPRALLLLPLLLLVAGCGSNSPAPPTDRSAVDDAERASPPPEVDPLEDPDEALDLRTPTGLIRVVGRRGRMLRDDRLRIGKPSAERARQAVVVAEEEGEELPPGTLLALGGGGEIGDVPLLEEYARGPHEAEAREAILALAELGAWGRAALGRLMEYEPANRAELLVLARIISDPEDAGAPLQRWAADAASPFHLAALLYLPYDGGGAWPAEATAVDEWLELRWAAARGYGLVDGRRWRDLLLAELVENEEFLDRTIYGASVYLDETSVRDHLFEVVLRGGEPHALPAAIQLLAGELGYAAAAGLWAPTSQREWEIIIATVNERRLERQAQKLLEHAWRFAELRPMVGIPLWRAGAELPRTWVDAQLRGESVPRRCDTLAAWADRGMVAELPELLDYTGASNPLRVQTAALVAAGRLADEHSASTVNRLIDEGISEERRAIVLAIARQTHDLAVAAVVARCLERQDLEPDLRFLLEVRHGIQGHLRDRSNLKEWLAENQRHPSRVEVVRALAQRPDYSDIEVLSALFPVEDDLEVNVELAIALLRHKQHEVLPVLRHAMWARDWNRSVLAGGLFAHVANISTLIDEIFDPPIHAREEDFRRIGFAIGEWGGLPAVNELARRSPPTDPVVQGAFLGALSTRTQ